MGTQTFDQYMEELGIAEEVSLLAEKKSLIYRILQVMKTKGISKTEMARRMGTSRTDIDRLLDIDNPSVTLETLQKAASVCSSD